MASSSFRAEVSALYESALHEASEREPSNLLQNAALRSVSRLKGRPLYISRFPLRGTPRRGKGCTRVRIIMILLRQFMQGQLRLTWRSYAGPPQSVQHRVSFRHLTSYTPAPLRGPLSTGKRLTKFSVAYGSLQISFACHP